MSNWSKELAGIGPAYEAWAQSLEGKRCLRRIKAENERAEHYRLQVNKIEEWFAGLHVLAVGKNDFFPL